MNLLVFANLTCIELEKYQFPLCKNTEMLLYKHAEMLFIKCKKNCINIYKF